MTDVQIKLLDSIHQYPGDFTTAEHAIDLGLDIEEARQASYRLSEQGLILPRAYRLAYWAREALDDGRKTPETLVGHGAFQKRTWDKAVAWVTRLWKSGPFVNKEGPESLSGSDKRLLATLNLYGIVCLPECLWPAGADKQQVCDRLSQKE